MIVVITSCVAVALMSLVYAYCQRKKSRQLLARLDQQLNRAIAGVPLETVYDEAYLSLIEDKLNQFLSIQQKHASDSQEAMQEVQATISNIAHQLKTPLSNVLLYSQLLSEQIAGGNDLAREIEQQAQKLADFVESLVRTSYLEQGLIQLAVKDQPIGLLVRESVKDMKLAALKKQVTIEYQDTDATAFFDWRWTKEALLNILDNAVKYSPVQGKVSVTVTRYEFFHCITVCDEGPGIPEIEQAQIFDRFYRGTASSRATGLGIGLYLAKTVLTAQHGYLSVLSQGAGACFALYLPRTKI